MSMTFRKSPWTAIAFIRISATLRQKLRMVVWYRWALPFPPIVYRSAEIIVPPHL
jgi:hypothetical protein